MHLGNVVQREVPQMSDTPERFGIRAALDRRTLLRGGTLALGGVAAAALIGCGGDESNDNTPASTGTSAASTGTAVAINKNQNPAQLTPKDPNLPYAFGIPEPDKPAKDGGTLNVAVS